MGKRIFISADHGLAVIYFLQSDLVPSLLNAGVEIVILTDDPGLGPDGYVELPSSINAIQTVETGPVQVDKTGGAPRRRPRPLATYVIVVVR